LGPRVHALSIFLIAPGDGDELDLFQETGIVVWYDPASAVSEDNVSEFERLGFAGALGADNLAWASSKKEAGYEEIDGMVDCAGFGRTR
jgi:hypothetical protein